MASQPPSLPTIYDSAVGISTQSIPQTHSVIYCNGYSSSSDINAGHRRQRLASPPAHNLYVQSADGAYWEYMPENGVVNVLAIGWKGDNATDHAQKFVDLQNFLIAKATNTNVFYLGGYRVKIPNGRYYSSATWDFKGVTAIWEGDSNPLQDQGGATTIIEFAANTIGFRTQRYNTILETVQSPTGQGADGTRFKYLDVRSRGGTDTTKHGMRWRTRTYMDGCVIAGFPGDGLNIVAGAGGGGAVEGNANLCVVNGLYVLANGGNGVFIDGPDTNAGSFSNVSSVNNGRWGIWDSSFLGNYWEMPQTQGNGTKGAGCPTNVNTGSSIWFFGGHCWCPMEGQETAASTTQPGTDPTIWADCGTGNNTATTPLWTSGVTVFQGGSYRADSVSARGQFDNAYAEGGQALPYSVGPTVFIGGLVGTPKPGSNSPFISPAAGFLNLSAAYSSVMATTALAPVTVTASLGGAPSLGQLVQFTHSTWAPATHRLLYNTGGNIEFNYQNSNASYLITGPLTTVTFGRVSPRPHVFTVPSIGLGGASNNGRVLSASPVLPVAGEAAQGDIILNSVPVSGGNAGWVNLVTGANGSTAWSTIVWALYSFCSNAGIIYQCTGIPTPSVAASIAPSQTSGSVTGADGYTWTVALSTSWAKFGNTAFEISDAAYPGETISAGAVGATRTISGTTITSIGTVSLGDRLDVSFGANSQGAILQAWITGTNNISYRFINPAGASSSTIPAGTVFIGIRKK